MPQIFVLSMKRGRFTPFSFWPKLVDEVYHRFCRHCKWRDLALALELVEHRAYLHLDLRDYPAEKD